MQFNATLIGIPRKYEWQNRVWDAFDNNVVKY